MWWPVGRPVDGVYRMGSDSGKARVACDAGAVTIASRPEPADDREEEITAPLDSIPIDNRQSQSLSSAHPTMTIQAKFDRAVYIVQNLPKDGPVQPNQDEQLIVCF